MILDSTSAILLRLLDFWKWPPPWTGRRLDHNNPKTFLVSLLQVSANTQRFPQYAPSTYSESSQDQFGNHL